MHLSQTDIKNLLALLQRVNVTGAEAKTLATLQDTLAAMIVPAQLPVIDLKEDGAE